mmetsp:Transcript_1540/g.4858  ORF Transcript_1540/g.4858 Transcript_1540/m.4858 type:complete len:222 (-) Transcript_1540:525-1190(-)
MYASGAICSCALPCSSKYLLASSFTGSFPHKSACFNASANAFFASSSFPPIFAKHCPLKLYVVLKISLVESKLCSNSSATFNSFNASAHSFMFMNVNANLFALAACKSFDSNLENFFTASLKFFNASMYSPSFLCNSASAACKSPALPFKSLSNDFGNPLAPKCGAHKSKPFRKHFFAHSMPCFLSVSEVPSVLALCSYASANILNANPCTGGGAPYRSHN